MRKTTPIRTSNNKLAHPIDIAVGKRMRELRLQSGFTQQQMASELNVSFQQVQKYEVAANRISMSRLWEIAQILNLSMTDFFTETNISSQIAALSEETLKVAQDIDAIRSKRLRRKFVKLIRACADTYR